MTFDDVAPGTALGNPARLGPVSFQHSNAYTFKVVRTFAPVSSPSVLAPFDPDGYLAFGETTLRFRTTPRKIHASGLIYAAGLHLVIGGGSNQDTTWTSTVTARDVRNSIETETVAFRGQVAEQRFIGFSSRWPLASISFSTGLRADGGASTVVAIGDIVLR